MFRLPIKQQDTTTTINRGDQLVKWNCFLFYSFSSKFLYFCNQKQTKQKLIIFALGLLLSYMKQLERSGWMNQRFCWPWKRLRSHLHQGGRHQSTRQDSGVAHYRRRPAHPQGRRKGHRRVGALSAPHQDGAGRRAPERHRGPQGAIRKAWIPV